MIGFAKTLQLMMDTMMTNMIERVARALHEWQSTIPWEVTSQQDIAYARAKVAIKAMRDPTSEMTDAGEDVISYSVDDIIRNRADVVWQAMIDASLAQKIEG